MSNDKAPCAADIQWGPQQAITTVREADLEIDEGPPSSMTTVEQPEPRIHRTDVGNGHRFIQSYGDLVIFVPAWRQWAVWDGMMVTCVMGSPTHSKSSSPMHSFRRGSRRRSLRAVTVPHHC